MLAIGRLPLLRAIPDRSNGFTLIELLVVLAIISLALSMVPPLTNSMAEAAREKASVKTLTADLRWLRHQAIASGQETALIFNLRTQEYVRSADHLSRKMPKDIQLTFRSASPSPGQPDPMIRFFPDGTSSGGRVDLAHGTYNSRVLVSWPFGRILYLE